MTHVFSRNFIIDLLLIQRTLAVQYYRAESVLLIFVLANISFRVINFDILNQKFLCLSCFITGVLCYYNIILCSYTLRDNC